MPNPRPRTPAALRSGGEEILGDDAHAYQVSTMSDALRVAEARDKARADGSLPVLFEGDPDPYGYLSEIENETGLNLLTPNWKARPDDPMWVKRFRGRARKAVVAKLFLQGYQPSEIATKVQMSESTVLRDITYIQQEWQQSYLGDMESIAATDMQRLEYYLTKLSAGIERGDVRSIRAATAIIQERGNILGYRQGMQVDIEQMVREVASSNGYDEEKAVEVARRISFSFK